MFSKNKKTYDKFSLINRFNKYNKFKEFTDLDSMEVKAALFLTILTFIICGIGLNLYGQREIAYVQHDITKYMYIYINSYDRINWYNSSRDSNNNWNSK